MLARTQRFRDRQSASYEGNDRACPGFLFRACNDTYSVRLSHDTLASLLAPTEAPRHRRLLADLDKKIESLMMDSALTGVATIVGRRTRTVHKSSSAVSAGW